MSLSAKVDGMNDCGNQDLVEMEKVEGGNYMLTQTLIDLDW